MLEQLNTWVWGSGLLVLLLGTGLFLSIRTHFFQIFGIRTIFRQTFGRLFRREDGAEQWKTCSAALAAAMGTLSVLQQPFPLAEQGQFFGCGCLRFWA